MSIRKRTLAALIAKARRGEDIGIREDSDTADAFATLDCILDGWDHHRIRPSEDEIEVLIEAARYAVLPLTVGRSRTPREAKQRAAQIKREARAYQRTRRPNAFCAEDAWRETAREMTTRYSELEGKPLKTLIDRWRRR